MADPPANQNWSLEMTINNPEWVDAVPDIDIRSKRSVAAVAAHENAAGEISLMLSDDRQIQELNRAYRNIDRPTNVLAFPQDAGSHVGRPEDRLLGDVIVSLDTARREAGEGAPLGDHVSHLIVHGVLHLLGYDHETDAEAGIMEAHEVRILADLNIADPYQAELVTD